MFDRQTDILQLSTSLIQAEQRCVLLCFTFMQTSIMFDSTTMLFKLYIKMQGSCVYVTQPAF